MWKDLRDWLWDSRKRLRCAEGVFTGSAVALGVWAAVGPKRLGLLAALAVAAAWVVARRLKQLTGPRRLSRSQKAKLVYALLSRTPRTVSIRTPVGELEAERYANDLDQAFKEGGWNTQRRHAYGFHDQIPTGLMAQARTVLTCRQVDTSYCSPWPQHKSSTTPHRTKVYQRANCGFGLEPANTWCDRLCDTTPSVYG